MNKISAFALVDCNNFFVSCERVFAPHLENKAVVVLSNNDGCAISRSNEAKLLGIKMGEPFFKFEKLYKNKQVEVISSNAKLYSNISWRIMEILKASSPLVEVYSIDEAFLDLTQINPEDHISFVENLKNKIKQWTGIPVSIGIAPTKTLAKIANYFAKKQTGIYNLFKHPNLDNFLEDFPVEEIWGIGRKLAPRMRILGIGNAKNLRDSDPDFIRKCFSIVEETIIFELRGKAVLELVTLHKKKKSITYSRSFSTPISELDELEKSLSHYANNACVKLRKQNSRASSVCVYIRTNKFSQRDLQYNNSILITLPYPSSNTIEIIMHSKAALQKIYKPGYKYNKIGIILTDFVSDKVQQIQLFNKPNYRKSDILMKTIDSINTEIGKNTVFIASEGIDNSWKTKQNKKSPDYTTNWNELPIVKAN